MRKFFELKKFIWILVLGCFFIHNQCFAGDVSGHVFQDGVEAYRKGDAQECLEIMNVLKKKDPSNAYVMYYLAMSNTKLGNFDEAKENYEKVIFLNEDEQLTAYAKEGIQNIENATSAGEKKVSKKSYSADKPPVKEADNGSEKTAVSDDEIAKAIKTLRAAGLLNVNLGVSSAVPGATGSEFLQQNSDLMNLNMMMGAMGGSKSSGMDMLPMLMMQQGANGGKSNISPEVIQMMMNNAMLDGMSAFDTNNKDK